MFWQFPNSHGVPPPPPPPPLLPPAPVAPDGPVGPTTPVILSTFASICFKLVMIHAFHPYRAAAITKVAQRAAMVPILARYDH